MIANNNNKAMLTRGPMALPMADITTCKPEKQQIILALFIEAYLFYMIIIGYRAIILFVFFIW